MKQIYLPLLAVLALASCSKSELAMRPNDGQVEIMATSQALSIDTRAPFEGQIEGGNPLTANVIMSQTSGDYTTPYGTVGTTGTMTFTDNGTTEAGFNTTPQYYPADDSQIYLSALYPETGWTAITTTATYTIDGKSDLMAAAEQTSKKSEAIDGTFPTFSFNHLLTKLTVKVVAADQAAIDAWGAITEMTTTQADGQALNLTATVTLKDGTAAFTGAQGTPLNFYTITDGTTYNDDAVAAVDHTITLTTDPTLVAYSLVPPITARAQAHHFDLSVKTEKSGEAIAVPVNLEASLGGAFSGDTRGKAFEITITFKATEIKAKATVTDWEDAGSSDVEIQ